MSLASTIVRALGDLRAPLIATGRNPAASPTRARGVRYAGDSANSRRCHESAIAEARSDSRLAASNRKSQPVLLLIRSVGRRRRPEVMFAVAAAAIRPSARSIPPAGQARATFPSLCLVLTRSHDSRRLSQRGRLLGTYLKHIICNAIDRGASETQRSHAMRASFCAAPIHLYAAVARIPKTVSLPSESS
jgi:hypothetical protein